MTHSPTLNHQMILIISVLLPLRKTVCLIHLHILDVPNGVCVELKKTEDYYKRMTTDFANNTHALPSSAGGKKKRRYRKKNKKINITKSKEQKGDNRDFIDELPISDMEKLGLHSELNKFENMIEAEKLHHEEIYRNGPYYKEEKEEETVIF